MKTLEYLLQEFNFSESEAKVYIALLQNGSCSGYEISKYSGVSRSKIYNVLESLYQKSAISINRDGKGTLYCAESTENLAEYIRSKTNHDLAELIEQGDKLRTVTDDEHFWNIYSRRSAMIQTVKMIEKAEEELVIQVWKEELIPELEKAIIDAEERLGKVIVVLYDKDEIYDTKIKRFYKHGFEKDKIDEMGGRWLMAVVDSKQLIYSAFIDGNMVDAFYTHNRNMALFAREYGYHDAYTLRLIDKLHDQAIKEFGKDLEGVRDIFSL